MEQSTTILNEAKFVEILNFLENLEILKFFEHFDFFFVYCIGVTK